MKIKKMQRLITSASFFILLTKEVLIEDFPTWKKWLKKEIISSWSSYDKSG